MTTREGHESEDHCQRQWGLAIISCVMSEGVDTHDSAHDLGSFSVMLYRTVASFASTTTLDDGGISGKVYMNGPQD